MSAPMSDDADSTGSITPVLSKEDLSDKGKERLLAIKKNIALISC